MSTIEQFELFFDGIMKREAVDIVDDQRLYRLANRYGVPSVLVRVCFFIWETAQHRDGSILERAEKR